MTRFLLIRHATHDLLGHVLTGRMPGVALNERGRQQARQLAEDLKGIVVDALYSSPIQRCRETADPLAETFRLPLQLEPAVQEIDFGLWTGMSFRDLEGNLRWHLWNVRRTSSRPPYGESMQEVQERLVVQLKAWAEDDRERTIAVISHGDPIKSVVAHCCGEPLDKLPDFDVGPASVTVLGWSRGSHRVFLIGEDSRKAAELLRALQSAKGKRRADVCRA